MDGGNGHRNSLRGILEGDDEEKRPAAQEQAEQQGYEQPRLIGDNLWD
jgi:hypothetical protein